MTRNDWVNAWSSLPFDPFDKLRDRGDSGVSVDVNRDLDRQLESVGKSLDLNQNV